MSDIKYIIAGDGEHRRFPCLAVLRYALAAAVTMLAIAVVALVIHAMLRSEDIHLSINNGFIGAEADSLGLAVSPAASRSASELVSMGTRSTSRQRPLHVPAIPAIGWSHAGGKHPGGSSRQYQVNITNLLVILIATNPGGRTKIDCNDTIVSLNDSYYPYGQIGNLTVANFTVPAQTTIKLQERLKNINTSYIEENYPYDTSFSVTVMVKTSVTSYPLGKIKTMEKKYECYSITVAPMDDEAFFATGDVDCSSGHIAGVEDTDLIGAETAESYGGGGGGGD